MTGDHGAERVPMPAEAAAPPVLSVIMPVHDGERWIAAALDSLCQQGGRGFECLVIDSSRTDASLDIVRRYSDRLDLRIERRPDVLPWTAKTNLGARIARGRFICMLHQDDLWAPGRLARVLRWIGEQPDASLFLHAAHIIDAQGRRLGVWRCPLPSSDAAVPRDVLLSRLIVQNFVAIPSPTINRAAFLALGGLDEELWYTADWDVYLKLASFGDVFHRSDALASFRIHDASQTMVGSRGTHDFRDQMARVLDRHSGGLASGQRTRALRSAQASIDVNVALARLNQGHLSAGGSALVAILRLGPIGAYRYCRDSRILERVLPRARARLAQTL